MELNNTKISNVGDIHLNLRSTSVEQNSWERTRFLLLINVLATNDSGIILLNGDTFDKAKATYEEIGLFYEGIEILESHGKIIYVTDGNHEEISDGVTTFDYLPHKGYSRIKVDSLSFDGVDVWIVGHPYINMIDKGLLPISYDKKNILISHYRSDIGYADAEIDNEKVSSTFDDTILSDIHYRLSPAHNIQYTSSPYGIHFTPDKDYGYCTLEIADGDYKIEFIKLDLPSKVKVVIKQKDLTDTLPTLDTANRYNLEVVGISNSENLMSISEKQDFITKFNFTDIEDSIMEVITDDLKEAGDVSVSEIIMIALDDVELSDSELVKAKKILQEVL